MPKLTRLLALAAAAALLPAAGATAQGVYDPYNPQPPGQQPPGQQPPTQQPPGQNPQQGDVLTPRDLAEDVRADVIEELGALRSLRARLLTARKTEITIAVNGRGTYYVELKRKINRRKTITLARGKVTTRSANAGTRDLKLQTTAIGRAYIRAFKGQKLKIDIRTGFKAAGARRITWTTKASTFDLVAKNVD